MKYTTLIRLLVSLAFLCMFSPESQSGPPQVPGYKPPSHAQHPPGYKAPTHNAPGNPHHFTPPPHNPVHSPKISPGPYPRPGICLPPPPRIPVYLYPPVAIPYPIQVPIQTYPDPLDPYYESPRSSSSDIKQLGIFKAYVYQDEETEDVQQNGVAVFYLNDQNLIGGYFFIKEGFPPLGIQGIADKETGEVEFRVNGTKGTYFTKLKELITRDKIYLTLEKEENGEFDSSEVGYLLRVTGGEESSSGSDTKKRRKRN